MRERGKERGRRKHEGGDTEGGDKQREVWGGGDDEEGGWRGGTGGEEHTVRNKVNKRARDEKSEG